MNEIYFTSDHHFGHANIIKYSSRTEFSNVDEMNTGLIDYWNQTVKENDTVYHLGDMFLCAPDKAQSIIKQLHGKIHYIRGNHDKTANQIKRAFQSWSTLSEIKMHEQHIVLCHYAMRVWNRKNHGAWHLYGHSHGALPSIDLSMDVGVDCNGYKPFPYGKVESWMNATKLISDIS